MIERIGHAIVAWLFTANTSTTVLFVGALLLERAPAYRMRASLRILLYLPVALRVLVPFSWSIPICAFRETEPRWRSRTYRAAPRVRG